jgi:hypothetical protein
MYWAALNPPPCSVPDAGAGAGSAHSDLVTQQSTSMPSSKTDSDEEDALHGDDVHSWANRWVGDILPMWLLRRLTSRAVRRQPPPPLSQFTMVGGLPALPDEVWELVLTLLPLTPDEYNVETFGLLGRGWSANPPPTSCQLWVDPCSVIACSGNRLIVVDSGHNRLTMLIAASDHPRLLSLAGDTAHGHNDGSPASARFAFPRGAALDRDGTIWMTDRNCVRRLARGTLAVSPVAMHEGCLSHRTSISGQQPEVPFLQR